MRSLSPWIVLAAIFMTVRTEPTDNDERLVDDLPTKFFNTSIGHTHEVTIDKNLFEDVDVCNIVTPSGTQYNIEELNITGVEVIRSADIACGVKINVENEDQIGNWTLIYKGARYSTDKFEKRLTFTVHVEETVQASINEVILIEGNNLYIRLKNPITNYDTCRLFGPDGRQIETYEIDSRYKNSCGYIVKNVKLNDSGTWEIDYGERILYRAHVRVTVNGKIWRRLI